MRDASGMHTLHGPYRAGGTRRQPPRAPARGTRGGAGSALPSSCFRHCALSNGPAMRTQPLPGEVCAQTSPGSGWVRIAGPFDNAQCRKHDDGKAEPAPPRVPRAGARGG